MMPYWRGGCADGVGEYAPELRAIEANWPKIKFHALSEHAGLVFHKQLDG